MGTSRTPNMLRIYQSILYLTVREAPPPHGVPCHMNFPPCVHVRELLPPMGATIAPGEYPPGTARTGTVSAGSWPTPPRDY